MHDRDENGVLVRILSLSLGSAREKAYYPCMIKACVVGLRKVKYIRSVKVVEG